jgi:translocation and assembly module TamB
MTTPEQEQAAAPAQQAQPAAPAARVRRSRWRWLKWLAGALLLLALLALGLLYAALRTDWGARSGWQLTTRVLDGALSGEYVGGSVAHGLDLRNIRYHDQERTITVDRVHGAWDFRFRPRKLTINALELGHVDVTLQPSPKKTEPLTLPQQIRLPLAIDLQRLAIEEVLLHQEGATTRIADLLLRAGSDRVHHTLELQKADTPFGAAQAALKLGGDAPFPLTGSASLNGARDKLDYQASARLDGTLQALGVTLKAGGGNFNADAQIDATPFATLPFTRARVSVDHLNPRMFNAAAPQADLAMAADLAPLAAPAGAGLAELQVAGPISVTNARPGSIDQELLPLESLKANATLDAQRQRLDSLAAALRGGARLEGSGELRAGGDGELAVEARGLDLHALHAAVRPTRLNGPIKVALAGDTQQVTLRLDGPPFAIHADAGITPQEISLRSAHLEAGKARLDASGTLGRAADAAYAIEGALANFNPAAFLSTIQPPPSARRKGAAPAAPATIPEADINMRFTASGKLKPELQASVRFDIRDSSYAKLPMSGGGTLRLAGKQVDDSDIALAVAGNKVALQGGFGAPGKQLNFSIDAPAIDRLGFGLAGALAAKGQLAGTLERPLAQADIQGERLAFGEYRAAKISSKADVHGIPGSDPQAQIRLALQAQGVRAADLQLDDLRGDIDGSYASHTVQLQARGKFGGEALALTLAAAGRLQQLPEGLAWDGSVRTLENRGVPRLQMQQPLAVHYAPGQLTLGATRLEVEKAQVSLNSLDYRADGALRSQGSIAGLDVGHLLALYQRIARAELPLASDLVLDAGWNFTLGDTASGFFEVARKSGDISLPVAGRSTQLDLKQLRLRGDFAGQALRIDAALDTARLGKVGAQGQIGLQQSGPRLMPGPESALNLRIAAALPELANLGSLTGPRIALKGKVSANVTVAGTAGAPVVSGDIAGDQLALTLYDQGVRLQDGVARITLADNVAELRELVFKGGAGTLRASGRLPLDQARTDIAATIVADKLQLLADPSSQLTLSGQAKVANVGRQLQVTGKFTVDRGLFNLPEKSAPKLGDDVVVYRNGAKPKAANDRAGAADKPSSPYAPRVDVQVDLGDNFRFKGSGADLRLAGTLAIRTGPNEALRAAGTINIAEGKYEAFGAVLNIERGVLNFTGPLTNPNLNILAMRRNQDVAAGVQVTGTVQLPRVQLVSDPNVADEEKLSWLVFGHGGSGGTGGAQAAARGAATGLLNTLGSEKVARRLGLDELSFGSSKTGLGSEQVVNLGKNITERLAIGYEQSLAGAASVLKLTYQLNRAWSVVLRGGQIAGLDLAYSRRFDRFGEDSSKK